MDTRQSSDTGASMGPSAAGPVARPGGRFQRRPITEYLRHVSGGEGAAAREVLVGIPPKLYRASEIAQHLDVTRQTVHNYATIGLITEERRTPGGQRLFGESVFPRLLQIQRLKRTHRLHEIRRIFDQQQRRSLSADDAKRGEEGFLTSGRGGPEYPAGEPRRKRGGCGEPPRTTHLTPSDDTSDAARVSPFAARDPQPKDTRRRDA